MWNDGLRELSADAGPDDAPATGVAFTADGKRLVSVSRDSEVRWWDAATGQLRQRSFGHEHPIRTTAASPVGDVVASAGEETRIMVWDAKTGKLTRILNRHSDFVNGLSFSSDGKLLASAGRGRARTGLGPGHWRRAQDPGRTFRGSQCGGFPSR